ncbi:MAG: hypothetical protein RI897_4082, partial [Verrucomicrobiota bacterium]
ADMEDGECDGGAGGIWTGLGGVVGGIGCEGVSESAGGIASFDDVIGAEQRLVGGVCGGGGLSAIDRGD